jgi:ankyrin repeat protein
MIQEQVIKEYLIAAALQKTEMLCYFIEAEGLHPDATWNGKPTALCYAAMKRNSRMVTYLIDRGADVNYADALGMTPLHYAALSACDCTAACLIARGAALNAVNHAGRTPLALALCSPGRRDCYEFLRRHGASLEAVAPAASLFH